MKNKCILNIWTKGNMRIDGYLSFIGIVISHKPNSLPQDGKEKSRRTAEKLPCAALEGRLSLVKKIGKTLYKACVHFNTASETMSDKIKRMLKNEVQQM